MKKLITKFWGLALVVIILSSLLVAAAPVSAGNLAYTVEGTPSFIGGIVTAGQQLQDMAVSADGQTIYAVSGAPAPPFWTGVFKSTNGGATFSAVTVALTFASGNLTAMAPDDPNFVVVIDTATAGGVVWVSINGGATWASIGGPRSSVAAAATAIYDVDVSPTYLGGHYIGVSGATAAGAAFFVFNTGGGLGSGWYDAATEIGPGLGAPAGLVPATYDGFRTGKFSPAFAGDLTAVLVANVAATGTLSTHVRRFSIGGVWNASNGATFAAYPFNINTGAAGDVTNKVDLALSPDYTAADDTLRIGFVGAAIAGATARGGLWRIGEAGGAGTATSFFAPTVFINFNSVAMDGTSLVAGAFDTNAVYFSTAPLSALLSAQANRAVKRTGGNTATNRVVVGFSGVNVVSISQGASGAFAVSMDGGLTFNDVSLINTTLAAIDDFQVSADGTKKYVVSNNGVNTSVFRFNGTSWARVMTLAPLVAVADGYIVRVAPENFDTVYVADIGATNIFYSADAGQTRWTNYIATGAIADVAVESVDVVYVASGNRVSKSINHGFSFGPGFGPTGWGVIVSLRSFAANQLIAGSGAGQVAYSTDGGTTWTGPIGALAAGNTYATADKLEAGGIIYAVTSANNLIYRWTIGTSIVWDTLGAGGTAGTLSTGIELASGALYRLGSTVLAPTPGAGVNSEISRSINPSFAVPILVTVNNISANATNLGAGVTANISGTAVPDALKVVGTTVYFTDTSSPTGVHRIFAYTDTLAAPTAAPALTSPATNALVQVIGTTPNPVTFTWSPVTGATSYRVQVAQDSAFTQLLLAGGFVDTAGLNLIVGGAGNLNGFASIPGGVYYWRVRVQTPAVTVYSETRSFRIQPAAAAVPVPASPATGALIQTQSPAFSWNPIAGTTKYSFILHTNPSFAGPEIYKDTPTTAGALLPVTIELERGKQYFWRVKALEPIEGDWSTVANFMVAEEAAAPPPPVVIEQLPAPVINIPAPVNPPAINIPPQPPVQQITPGFIWAIIIIGAVLVIAVIVLIVRTRRTV